jgi:hypothetical protein
MLRPMQRLFSMFPNGLAGLALLVLRISLLFGIFFTTKIVWTFHPLLMWLSVIVGILLCAGIATPICATLCFIAAIVAVVKSDAVTVVCSTFSACVAAAVVLLGPGAFSIDALLFGRKRMLFDKRKKDT